ncbi:MAG: helix-hairpin-helix domain-containing protein [Fibrobacteres bacterium]|nr:helix-hairpin-helix domain-containing protein [Fibrobacterota bacterium]
MDYAALIAKELNLQVWQVANTLALLAEGATIPFIARYRKERTGEMDETVLREVDHRFTYLKELDERRAAILKSIEEQGKLTPELKAKIESCAQKNELEDIYLPYKPKRRTRAIIAREAGLEPLARLFQEKQSEGSLTPEELAKEYISEEKGVPDEATAVRMACDILAEELSEVPEIRQWLRGQAEKDGVMRCEARKEWVGKRTKFEMYYDFKEKVETLPSHRILAIRRGEKEDVLRSSIEVDVETAVGYVTTKIVTHPATMIGMVLSATARDAYERLLAPSIETDVRLLLKEHAEGEAYKVFGKNLGDLMMYPPAGAKAVIGVDPGFRTGQKLAVVDDTGKFLEHATVHALEPANQFEEATLVFLALCKRHKPILVAVGNGTGGREMESFLRKVIKNIPEEEGRPHIVMVSEAGASVYSASPLAVKEFPELDVTIRGAISIARRLQDPLAELVKIDPKSIGVGQYQHDVNQNELKKNLEEVVESCVNQVGVNLNQASEALLSYVSGITKNTAKEIVQYRDKEGAFKTRDELRKVKGFGPKSFEQAAGFLRLAEGENPLDRSAVHPERYALVERIAKDLEISVSELIGNADKIRQIDPVKYVSDEVGLPTLKDILSELEKPARDPRAEFTYANFDEKVSKIGDLQTGMQLEGVVTNVTNFGAFIDIGVHQDGLVHISQISDRFIKDAKEVLSVGQVVKVRVLEIDPQQKRIALTMKSDMEAARAARGSSTERPERREPREPRGEGRPQGDRPRGPRPEGGAPRGDRPQGDRPQGDRGPRPEGRAFGGDRPQGDRPQGDRGPRPEGARDGGRPGFDPNRREQGRPGQGRPQGDRPQGGPGGPGGHGAPRGDRPDRGDRGDRGPREWIDRPQQDRGPRQPATLEGLMEKFGGQAEKKQNNVKPPISVKALMRGGR